MQKNFNCATRAQRNIPLRGVWHRPNPFETERNLEELCLLLDRFCHSGINTVFLETFFHGMTVFKTDKAEYYRRFENCSYGEYPDYLSAFLTEANKRGIEVHAWVQDFYIGFREDIRLVTEHPDWLLINQQGGIRHTTEGQGFGGYIFLDPGNPEARKYLLDLYDELLTRFPNLSGLNLDYIRYPISVFDENTDTGYTEVCMNDFAKKEGLTLDPKRKRESLNEAIGEQNLLARWTAHRAYYITQFVKSVCETVREKHCGKLVSTAVFPELEVSYNLKKQAISVWLDKKYIDTVTPMVYFYEADKVFSAVESIKQICNGAACCVGLYTTYHGQSVEELRQHIEAGRRAGADGFVLFDSAKTFFEAKDNYEAFLSEYRYGASEQ